MKAANEAAGAAADATPPSDATPVKPLAPYTPPVLERLGSWRALTLQQSVPIFP